MKSTVGRIVHYHLDDVGPIAALVVCTNGVLSNLRLFMPDGDDGLAVGVEQSEQPKHGCWSWLPAHLLHPAMGVR